MPPRSTVCWPGSPAATPMRSRTTGSRTTYRHARLLDHGRGDWAMTIARRYLYETADAIRLEALGACTWAPLAELVGKLSARSATTRCTSRSGSTRLARAGGESRRRLRRRARDAGPRCRDGLHATPRRAGTGRGGHPRLADARAGGVLASRRSRRRCGPSTCRSPRRPVRRSTAAKAMARRSAGCGASSRACAAATPERPGERGAGPTSRSPGHARASGTPAAPPPPTSRPSGRPSPRSWIRSCRWSRSSTSGWSATSPSPPTRSMSRCCRRTSAARRSSSSAAPVTERLGAFGRPVRVGLAVRDRRGPRTASRRPAGRPSRRPGSRRPRRIGDVRCPLCGSGAGRDGQPVRADPVPLALLLPGVPPAVRSHQAGLTVDGRRSARSASSAPARWARASPSSRSRPATSVRLYDAEPAAGDGAIDADPRRARPAGGAAGPATPMRSTTGSRARAARLRVVRRRSTISPGTRRWSSRPRSRTCRRSARSSRRSTRPRRPTRSSRPTQARCPWRRSRAATRRPGRVVGLHFFNPAPLMRLVEVVGAPATIRVHDRRPRALMSGGAGRRSGRADAPGFIVNRVNRPFTLEPLAALEAGEATIEAIDLAPCAPPATRWGRSS